MRTICTTQAPSNSPTVKLEPDPSAIPLVPYSPMPAVPGRHHLLTLPLEVRLRILGFAATHPEIQKCKASTPISRFHGRNSAAASYIDNDIYMVHRCGVISNPYISLFLINKQLNQEIRIIKTQRLRVRYHNWHCFAEAEVPNDPAFRVFARELIDKVEFTTQIPRILGLELDKVPKFAERRVELWGIAQNVRRQCPYFSRWKWELVKEKEEDGRYRIEFCFTV